MCPIEQLAEREKYWIDYYDTYNNGYNATRGGEGNCKIDYKQVINDYSITKCCRTTAKNLGISAHSVGHILSSCGIEVENGGQNKKPVG